MTPPQDPGLTRGSSRLRWMRRIGITSVASIMRILNSHLGKSWAIRQCVQIQICSFYGTAWLRWSEVFHYQRRKIISAIYWRRSQTWTESPVQVSAQRESAPLPIPQPPYIPKKHFRKKTPQPLRIAYITGKILGRAHETIMAAGKSCWRWQ